MFILKQSFAWSSQDASILSRENFTFYDTESFHFVWMASLEKHKLYGQIMGVHPVHHTVVELINPESKLGRTGDGRLERASFP